MPRGSGGAAAGCRGLTALTDAVGSHSPPCGKLRGRAVPRWTLPGHFLPSCARRHRGRTRRARRRGAIERARRASRGASLGPETPTPTPTSRLDADPEREGTRLVRTARGRASASTPSRPPRAERGCGGLRRVCSQACGGERARGGAAGPNRSHSWVPVPPGEEENGCIFKIELIPKAQ